MSGLSGSVRDRTLALKTLEVPAISSDVGARHSACCALDAVQKECDTASGVEHLGTRAGGHTPLSSYLHTRSTANTGLRVRER